MALTWATPNMSMPSSERTSGLQFLPPITRDSAPLPLPPLKGMTSRSVPERCTPIFSLGNGGCGPHNNPNGVFGVMDINAFDPWVTGTALPTAHITANQFPILLIYNVVMSIGPPTIVNCCVLGYHGATKGPPNGQTYSQAGSLAVRSPTRRFPLMKSGNGWMTRTGTTPLRTGETSGR